MAGGAVLAAPGRCGASGGRRGLRGRRCAGRLSGRSALAGFRDRARKNVVEEIQEPAAGRLGAVIMAALLLAGEARAQSSGGGFAFSPMVRSVAACLSPGLVSISSPQEALSRFPI